MSVPPRTWFEVRDSYDAKRRYSWPVKYPYLLSNRSLRLALGLRGLLDKNYMTPELKAFEEAINQVVKKYSQHGTILLRGDVEFGHHIHREVLSAALDVLHLHGRTIWPQREGIVGAHPKWLYDADSTDEKESNLVYHGPAGGINEDYVCIEARFLNLVLEQCIKRSYTLNGNRVQQISALKNASTMDSEQNVDEADYSTVASTIIGRTRSSALKLKTSTQRQATPATPAASTTSPGDQAESGPASDTEDIMPPIEVDHELSQLELRLSWTKMSISNEQIEGVIGLGDCETAEALFATATRWLGAPVQALVVRFVDGSLHQRDIMIEHGSEAQDAWDIVLEVLTRSPVSQRYWLIGEIRR